MYPCTIYTEKKYIDKDVSARNNSCGNGGGYDDDDGDCGGCWPLDGDHCLSSDVGDQCLIKVLLVIVVVIIVLDNESDNDDDDDCNNGGNQDGNT